MATTTFLDGQTIIYASWLNDVNTAVYSGTFPNGVINLTSLTATTITCTTLTASNLVGSIGNNFAITTSSSKIYFTYNGTNIASIDSSGNLRVLGSTITGTTP